MGHNKRHAEADRLGIIARAKEHYGLQVTEVQLKALRRLEEVEDLMVDGMPARQIQFIKSNEWGVSRRTVRSIMADVRKVWRAEARNEGGTEDRRNKHRMQLERIVFRSNLVGDRKSALAALSHLAALDGLNVETGRMSTDKIRRMIELLTTEEMEKLVAEFAEMTPKKGNETKGDEK